MGTTSSRGEGKLNDKRDLKDIFEQKREIIDKYLSEALARKDMPERLSQCIAYSLLDGGKRIRPALCMTISERLGVMQDKVLPLAAAFEMAHTASLIHDDLPCMDNDDYRRGKLTNHKVYGEAMAVLAGDALLAFAFELALQELPKQGFDKSNILKALNIFSNALGPAGICGGQTLDIIQEGVKDEENYVWDMCERKTATLLRATITAPAALAGADDKIMSHLYNYGTHLGISFQIIDDILDVTGTVQELGKTPGKDVKSGKLTFVTVYGLQRAKKLAAEETSKAIEAIIPLGEDFMIFADIAEHFAGRSK